MVHKLAIVAVHRPHRFRRLPWAPPPPSAASEFGKEFRRPGLLHVRRPAALRDGGSATATSRTLDWDGSDHVSLPCARPCQLHARQ